MAIYNRVNNTSATAAPAVPSMDLGSIIVTSLQNAVESIQSEDKDTSLKDMIKQSLEESTVIRAIQTSSSRLSNLFGGKSNTTAKNEKGTPADKVMSSNLEKLLKSNTTAKNEKDTPADKMEKHMAELLQITKDDKKKERANESKVVQEKKKEKEHKTTIKEGFSAVKAVGATIIKNILLILVAVQLIAELIVLIKYGWHYLMGVFIPNTWTKIKLAWTGFWTKITAEIRNFFVGLFRPIFTKFGVDLGVSPEQQLRKKEIMKELSEAKDSNGNSLGIKDKLTNYSSKQKAAKDSLDELTNRLKGSSYEYLLSYLKTDELKQKISEGGDITSDIANWKNQWLSTAITNTKNKGDIGNQNTLESIDTILTGYQNQHLYNETSEATSSFKALMNTYPQYKMLLQEYEDLNDGLINVEAAVYNAQKAVMVEDYKQGDISEAESTALLADKKYGVLVKDALNQAKADLGENFKYEQDDKHEKWIKEYGEPWKESIKTMVNDLTKNIGINLQIGQNKSTPQVNEQNPNASK